MANQKIMETRENSWVVVSEEDMDAFRVLQDADKRVSKWYVKDTDNDDSKSQVDPYGFEKAEEFDHESYNEFMENYLRVLSRRANKWSDFIRNPEEASTIPKTAKAKRYMRKGVPAEHRAAIWISCSGAEALWRKQPDLYQKLLKGDHNPKVIEAIKTDIHRTFPDNIYFQNTPSDPNAMRQPLYNVLVALAHSNLEIGYCQGINFVVGMMLLIVKDEEKTFWLMDTVIKEILPNYYGQEMTGVKVDLEVFGELIKLKVPDVAAFMDRQGLTWPLVSTKWFLCLYADVMPIETVLRIWDCLFNEGNKILFRVGVALVKLNRERILRCETFPELMEVFKRMMTDPTALNCHSFMESIFKEPGSFPRAKIEHLRKTCAERLKTQGD